MYANKLAIGLAAGIAVGSVGLVGCSNSSPTTNPCGLKDQTPPCYNSAGQWVNGSGTVGPPLVSTTRQVPTTYPTTVTYAPPSISNDDFAIDLKTTRKQCFGSAGCNVEVEPVISYRYTIDQLSAYGQCDITYSISGDESGEVIETAYGSGGERFRITSSSLSTKSSRTTVSAKVIDVRCR